MLDDTDQPVGESLLSFQGILSEKRFSVLQMSEQGGRNITSETSGKTGYKSSTLLMAFSSPFFFSESSASLTSPNHEPPS